jgi:putative nucleotidyltransferase with HDIG domain
MGLPRVVTKLLEQAAELHHAGVTEFGRGATGRLHQQLGLGWGESGSFRLDSITTLEALIEELARPFAGSSFLDVGQLGEILEFAHELDTRLEAQALEDEGWDECVAGLAGLRNSADWVRAARALAGLRPAEIGDVAGAAKRIPLSPAAAAQIRELGRNREISVTQLERAASEDAAAAGLVLSAANSALSCARERIGDLRQAIIHMGPERTRQILMSGMVRRLFASGSLRPVWDHSLEVAAETERLAEASGTAVDGDAFLLGLLHDVGRLALLCLPGAAVATYQDLLARRVGEAPAEMFLFGFDHGVAGAAVLEAWKMPEEWIEAVRGHHTPERARPASSSLLYLAEEGSGGQEHLPSLARLNFSLRRTGLGGEALAGRAGCDAWWGGLRYVA